MEINGREWAKESIQTLFLHLGNLGDLALRLGTSVVSLRPHLKENGILPPTEFIKNLAKTDLPRLKETVLREGGISSAAQHFHISESFLKRVFSDTGFDWKTPKPIPGNHRLERIRTYAQDPERLRNLIIQAGSYEKAALWLGISVSYLRTTLDNLEIQNRHKPPTPEEAARAMQEFGSVGLASYHLGTTPNEFKKALQDWREHRDPLKTGNNSVSTGRVGEEYYFSLRKDFIPDGASSLTNHSQKGFDFQDSQFGKVNVKTARPIKLKGQKGYVWSWGVDMGLDSDNFALVLLDDSRKPIGLFMVSNRQTEQHPEGLNWKCWKDGTCGFSYRSQKVNPPVGIPSSFN